MNDIKATGTGNDHRTRFPCSPGCPGWGIFNGGDIQRCDECRRFPDDDAAIAHVAGLAWIEGQHLAFARGGGKGLGYPGDAVTFYSCEHPDCGPRPVVLPGVNGVQLPGGEIFCARHIGSQDDGHHDADR